MTGLSKNLYVLMLFFFITPSFSQVNYHAAIEEGKSAALEYIDKKEASAIGITLVSPNEIIWSGTFGMTNPKTGISANDSTLFGIGSVSKLIAAIAVMKLVDQGLVDLDTPLVAYVPNFKMRSKDYKNITVRMLLDHSAGLPGTDYRNLAIRTYYTDYLNQVLETLSKSRLKAPPGYMNVYCNDCYTLVEALIAAKTGKPYTQFVQEEIFSPLEMKNTLYPMTPFPENSYARGYVNDVLRPQEVLNAMASGAAYSSTADLAKIAQMLLNGGKKGMTQILSEASIAEMSKDSTKGRFNPVHSEGLAYGLGWDSVTQPGLKAVGFDGWAKGGDTPDYGSMFMVSPKAKLGVVVLGASKFSSEKAKIIAEKILMRALADNQLIKEFPSPLPLPSIIPPAQTELSGFPSGTYALFDHIMSIKKQDDKSLSLSLFSDTGFTSPIVLEVQQDGWFTDRGNPNTELKIMDAHVLGKNTQYLIKRNPSGLGHYVDYGIVSQKLEEGTTPLSKAWKARLPKKWLVVNAHVDELKWGGVAPHLSLKSVPGAPNVLAVRAPEDGFFHVVNPSTSNTRAKMMLVIPQLNGRDLNDLVMLKHQGKEWARYGSYMHQPLSTVPVLPFNKRVKVTIAPDGYAKWVAIKNRDAPLVLTIHTQGDWFLYDSAFKLLKSGKSNEQMTIPAGKGFQYLTVFGKPQEEIRVKISK